MNRKVINIVLLFIFIVSIMSLSANAAFGDIFRAGLTPIEDFFRGGWQNYEKTVTFVVFFFLFFSAYLIGMKKAMGELTRAHKTFAFAAAFLSSLIIVTTMRFDWVNLEYVAWFLIGVLTLFGIYTLLCKLGLEKHKFWAFLLALILTALLLWLIWYLMSEGRPLERFGGIRDRFARFGKKPKLEAAPIVPEERPPGEEVRESVGEEEEEGVIIGIGERPGGRGWLRYWWILLILFLVGSGFLGRRKIKEVVGRIRKKGAEEERGVEDPIEKLIRKLSIILERKMNIQKFVEKFENEKNKLVEGLNVIEREIKKEKGKNKINKFINEILPRLRDRKSEEFEELNAEYKSLKKLFDINLKIKHLFKSLFLTENYITTAMVTIKEYVGRLGMSQDRLQRLNSLLESLEQISGDIHSKLQIYFKLEKEEELREEKIRTLLSKKNIEDRIKEGWLRGEIKTEFDLKVLIDKEFEEYEKINELIKQEKESLKSIIKVLEEEKPIKVEVRQRGPLI